jgi:probable addiction module antidote protein
MRIGWTAGRTFRGAEDLSQPGPPLILRSIGVVARAKGMAQIAKDTGLARASLYRGLNAGGNPDFATVLKVLGSIGVELGVTAAGGPQSVAV